VPYQSTHNTGGVIMGDDPETSAVNNYLQLWDMDNIFVVGASAFAHNSGFNLTGTVGALSYRAAAGIEKYLEEGGQLAEANTTKKNQYTYNKLFNIFKSHSYLFYRWFFYKIIQKGWSK